MKRRPGLRVKSGVRAPSRLERVLIAEGYPKRLARMAAEMPPFEPSLPTFVTHTHLDPSSAVAFDLWKKRSAPVIVDGAAAISEPMPPIRCTMPTPCGHCWYCLQRKANP